MNVSEFEKCRKLVAEIVMRRSKNRALSALIVEGTADRKIYERHIDAKTCDVLPAGGRQEVIEVLKSAEKSRVGGFVGIIDGDADHFLGVSGLSQNVFRTDVTDSETMLFASDALDTLVSEFSLRENDGRNASKFRQMASDTRDAIAKAALPLGVARRLSHRDNWSVNFESLDFCVFIDSVKGTCDIEACIRSVEALPRRHHIRSHDISGEIKNVLSQSPNVWHVIRGHDVTRIMALCSERFLGVKLSDKDVERYLRLGFDRKVLESTKLYTDVLLWSQGNTPFSIWSKSA